MGKSSGKGGHNHPQQQQQQQPKQAKQPNPKPNKKKGQPPPVDKLIVPAIVIGVALLLYQFIKGLGSEIARVNVLDELELREVFFGEGGTGNSYVVLCQPEDSTIPISSVFAEAHADGSVPAEFRLLDCEYVLPASNKSVAERFKLNPKTRPTIFVSGTVGAPVQVPAKHLKTGSMLVKLLRGKLELRTAKIETTQDLRTKCLDKELCGLLLKGSKEAPAYLKEAAKKLLTEFPTVAFASVDSTVLYALNLEEHLPELSGGQPRFAVLKKLGGSLAVGGDRLQTSVAVLDNSNGATYLQMSNLVAGVVTGSIPTTKIAALPVIKTRTKKLEEQESAKRQRREEQKRRKEGGGSSGDKDKTPGGAFSANDGSREGRRAERDRRRDEHNKEHNVKPKTPEELAEIERRRRERMEDSARQWDIQPDDAGDGGKLDDLYEDTADEYYKDEDGDDADDQEDEDVIDLD